MNSKVRTVMTRNNLWIRPDGRTRLAPVFREHKSGIVSSKLSKMVEFLEETTPTSIGLSYQSLRVCFLQFVYISGKTRHECIVCGTNLPERAQEPNLTPSVDIYNPWGNVAPDVNPNYLYNAEKAEREKEFKKIFSTKKNQYSTHRLEAIRFFPFKWWQ